MKILKLFIKLIGWVVLTSILIFITKGSNLHMADIITTLHPEGQSKDNLYPNIKKENIPDDAIDSSKIENNSILFSKFNKGFLNKINEYNYLHKSNILNGLNLTYSLPFDLFFDGNKYYTSYNPKQHLNTGYTTCYISPNGDDSNSGLTKELPVKTLNKAYDVASNNWSTPGGTIIFLEGIYDIENLTTLGSTINRPFNFIGENDNCRIICGKNPTWVNVENNIYRTSNTTAIKDVADITTDKYSGIRLIKCETLNICYNTDFSYFIDYSNNYVYINTKSKPNDRIVLIYDTSISIFFLTNNWTTEVVSPYFDNLKFYGSAKNSTIEYSGCIWFGLSDGSKPMIPYFNNCSFSLGGGSGLVCRSSGEIVLYNCRAINNDGDGFQYFGDIKYVEINCIGAGNGNITVDSTHLENGSTAHDYCKGYRINCTYYNNNGGNCADNGNLIESVCLGCEAYNSSSKYEWYNQGFGLQNSSNTAYMYLFNCIAYGNHFDIEQVDSGNVIIKDTYYENFTGKLTEV